MSQLDRAIGCLAINYQETMNYNILGQHKQTKVILMDFVIEIG